MTGTHDKIPLIVVAGTNASGKSSLGIELAKKYNGEIISADSRQIFKGFDLCCGKVTEEERAIVPHHMLDICEAGTPYSVSDYQKRVYELIPQIAARGRLPFIVGGTGLYIDAVVKGYNFTDEKIDPAFRRELDKKTTEELQAMLSEDAREYLRENNSDFNNKRRLIRVVEKERCDSPLQTKSEPMFDALQIGVTWPKEQLHERIDERLATRLEQGMVEEISSYLDGGGDPEVLYGLGLEYKHIAWYVEGRYASLEEFSEALSRAIKQFARRQMKWFKRNEKLNWIDMSGDSFEEACGLIDAFLEGRRAR